jgi:hypothetical protein
MQSVYDVSCPMYNLTITSKSHKLLIWNRVTLIVLFLKLSNNKINFLMVFPFAETCGFIIFGSFNNIRTIINGPTNNE